MGALSSGEYSKRLGNVREKIKREGMDGYVLFSNRSINYLTGYNFIPTERPAAILITEEKVDATVPMLEKDAAESEGLIDEVYVYYDYPGNQNGEYHHHSSKKPEEKIGEMIENRDLNSLGGDMKGAPAIMGYEGDSLEEITGKDVQIEGWTEQMRVQKSDEEIRTLREGSEYADQAFQQIREMVAPGKNEVSMNMEMQQKTAENVIKDQGSIHVGAGELSYYRILSGPNTYNPHGQVENRELQQKDIILPGMALAHKGYNAELERTMFLGEPTEEQKNYFKIMLEAQKTAAEAVAAGVNLSTVDQEVHDYFREQGVLEHTRHHTGHGLGLQGHEKPFIDRGNDKKLKENMVVSLEPGIYVEGSGGFRHSDTFLVKETGIERLTRDPRDIESNILRK
jgi:Xaa-Pro dipeptidase